MKAKPLSILICAILSASNVFANIETTTPSQNTIQQEQNVAVQYALHNGKFYIKVAGLAFENVQDFLLNGEPITSKILELVTNKLAEVLKEQNAFTIALNLPKSTNFGGMIFGISSGNKIYSSEMPASVFAQDSIQTFDSVVSISDFDQIGNNRRSIVAGTILPGITNNAIYTTTSGAVQDLFIQSQPNDTRNTIINSGNAGLVGVGTNTPNAKLDLKGDMLVSPINPSGTPAIQYQYAKAPGLHFSFDHVDLGGEIASIKKLPTITGSVDYSFSPFIVSSSEMIFQARDKVVSPTYKKITMEGSPVILNATSQGKVGIGTVNPKEKLDVNGKVVIRGSDLVLGTEDGKSIGEKNTTGQRALVHADPIDAKQKDTLVVNYNGDFEGGVEIQSDLKVNGQLRAKPWYSQAYRWEQGNTAIKLMHSSQGFCFLTYVRGKFEGHGESVFVYIESNGYWYLDGRSGREGKDVAAEARCTGMPPIVFEVNSQAPNGWQKTGLFFKANDKLDIDTISNPVWTHQNPAIPKYNANGFTPTKIDSAAICPSVPIGKLVAKVGNQCFDIGTNKSITIPTNGELFLGFNDAINGFDNNNGKLEVNIRQTN